MMSTWVEADLVDSVRIIGGRILGVICGAKPGTAAGIFGGPISVTKPH
jgi:hypothetical protein